MTINLLDLIIGTLIIFLLGMALGRQWGRKDERRGKRQTEMEKRFRRVRG